jgi:hypothetical protein
VAGALNSLPIVRFDGVNDHMTFPLTVNGLTGATIFMVAANTANQVAGSSQAERAALFFNESAIWGTLYLSPFQTRVNYRFGTTQVGNQPAFVRPVSVGNNFTISTISKDNANEFLRVNRAQVFSQSGKLTTVAGCSAVGNLGRGYNDNTFFQGDLAEVMFYDRALTPAEIDLVENYLDHKYGIIPLPQITQQPANTNVFEPNPATFTVAATSSAALTYQWRRGGVDIGGANGSS